MDISQTLNKKRKLKLPHFRLVSLLTYLVFLLFFNMVLAPALGLGGKVFAASIDTQRLVDLANQSRAANGLPSLTVDQRLINAATNKGIDMFQKQYWSHYGPNGETPWQFIIAAGYEYTYAGENLAKDFSDTDSIHNAWMNSSSHRANILNTNYKNIGIAAIPGKQICNGTYPSFTDNNLSTCVDTVIVVEMFGTELGATSPVVIPTSTPKYTPVVQTPKVTATPIPVVAPSKPVILSPLNNSYINQNKIDVKGTSENGTSVNVYEGNQKIGTISTEGGAFDIRDIGFSEGKHEIKATSTRTNDPSAPTSASDPVDFTIDTQKPAFRTSDIQIQLNDISNNEYYIEGSFTDDTVSVRVEAGTEIIMLNHSVGANTFAGTIRVEKGNVGVVLTAYDQAGNYFAQEIKLPNPVVLSASSGQTSTNSTSFNTKQIINITIGIVLLSIFIIDAILVSRRKTKIDGKTLTEELKQSLKNRGAVMHHIVPILIVIITMSVTITGNII